MTTPILQCAYCKHYRDELHCKAFGDVQIPREIIINRHDHRKPYPGDNGIQFEPIKDE
jgi:uncharacterized Fe-S cluster-containing radical SAM superfamily protein